MVATSTLALRTGFLARCVASSATRWRSSFSFSSRSVEGILVTFPAWVLLVGGAVFVDELRRRG